MLQGLLRKEERAYRELVEDWSEKIYRIAMRFLRRPEEAREIVQEVFEKVVEKIHTFEGDSKLSTWLYRVTVNQALMRLRSEKRHPEVSWEEILPQYEDGVWNGSGPDWSRLPDEKLQEKESREFLQASLRELPEDYRAAYLLKDVEQLSEEEVCQALNLAKPVMKMRVHRARLFLKKKLEDRFLKGSHVD